MTPTPLLPEAQLPESLRALYAKMEADFEALPIATQPTDIIPGEGNADKPIMLIGEAPGHHEHVQRRPFVGRSGQFLRKTLEAVGLPPAKVYISNIVKVRPPENRDPTPAEIAAFKPYLDQEIELLQPKLIVTLGRFSMAKFLPDVKISQVHGRLHKLNWNNQRTFVLPMYHPAAGLRNGKVRASFEQDFQIIHKILDWIDHQHQVEAFAGEVEEALL